MTNREEKVLTIQKVKPSNPNDLIVFLNGETIGSIFIKQFPNKPGVHCWQLRHVNGDVAIVSSESECVKWFALQLKRSNNEQ